MPAISVDDVAPHRPTAALPALGRSRQQTSFLPCSTTTPSASTLPSPTPVSRAAG